MTYEEFKQNFLPEFLKIKSFAGKMKFANQYLTRIGSGSGRIVYDIDGKKVLKLAKNPKGVAQNEMESNIGRYYDVQNIVTEVFEGANDDTWIISEKAKKVGEKRIKELTGIPSLNTLFFYLRNFESNNKGGRAIFSINPEIKEQLGESDFANELLDLMNNYNVNADDLGRPSSYGEVLRDGQPTIVVTDYGLSDEIYTTHYSPQRKQNYGIYELYNFADGEDDILSDIGNVGQDQRRGMWALIPEGLGDGDEPMNDEFISYIQERDVYPNTSISNLPYLNDKFHECVNNLRETLNRVPDKKKFYNNLLKLQEYLVSQGVYDRDNLSKEEYDISEEQEVPAVRAFSLDDEQYATELSKAIGEKLGFRIIKSFHGGSNGYAFDIGNDRVFKITTDVGEADAASKIMRSQPKRIAKVYGLYKIVDAEKNMSYFGMIEQNVENKPVDEFIRYNNIINTIMPNQMSFVDFMIGMKKMTVDFDQLTQSAQGILNQNPEANISEIDRKKAYDYLIGLFEIKKELIALGIKSNDYSNVKNLGYENGVLTYFDFGGYRSEEPKLDNNTIFLPENDITINEDYDKNIADSIATQVANKMGLGQPKYIDSGSYGVAYDIGNDKVLKITSDRSEAIENKKLIDKPLKYIALPYNVFEISSRNNEIPETYAIVLEKLQTSPEIQRMFDRLEYVFNSIFGIGIPEVIEHYSGGYDNPDIDTNKINLYLKKNSQDAKFFGGLLRILEETRQYGVQSIDFLNPKNLGYKKNGILAFFDVGFSFQTQEPQAEKIEVDEDGTSKFSTINSVGQDDFPPYEQNDTSPVTDNNIPTSIDELVERIISSMAGSSTVDVKKKCRLAGQGNTSVACNQGDINNLDINPINEDIDASDAYGDEKSLQTLVDGRRDIALMSLYNPELEKIVANNGFNVIRIKQTNHSPTIKMSIVYRDGYEKQANRLHEIIKSHGGYVADETPNEAYEIGKLLQYTDDSIKSYIKRRYVRLPDGSTKERTDSELDQYDNNYEKQVPSVDDEFSKHMAMNEKLRYGEGVGDTYAEKRFNIPSEFQNFDDRYRRELSAVDRDKVVYRDTSGWSIIKNPESLKNIAPYVRAIVDGDGNLYTEQSPKHIHVTIIQKLEDLGLIQNQYDWDESLPKYFVTLQRYGNTNKFVLGESNIMMKPDEDRDIDDRFWSRYPSRKHAEPIFQQFLDKAKAKNPNIEFVNMRIQNYVDLNENNVIMNEAQLMSLQDLPFKQEVQKLGGKIYSVGGAVRDEFLGKESKDLDILITGIPMEQLEQIVSKYGRVDAVGKSFGILKFKPTGATDDIDIAIPRTEKPTGEGGHKGFEVSSDHALPIEKDLERRDFTINAIAKDVDGNIIDPYGGQKDLQNKIIRVVNPEAFSDDPLRMLRAIQFASRFGFEIEPQTMKMIQDNAERIKEIPPERILTEFDKIVKKGNPTIGAQLLNMTGLYGAILEYKPKISFVNRPFKNVKTLGEFIFLLTTGAVQNPAEFYKNNLKGDIDSYKEIKALEMAYENGEARNPIQARTVAHNMYVMSPKSLNSQILPNAIKNAAQELLLGKYPKTIGELAVNGNDLMQLGLKGKEIGDALKNMLLKIYANKLQNSKEELISLINSNNNKLNENINTWNINGEDVGINFFVRKYDEWNNQGNNIGYSDPSKTSVLEFLENNFEDFSHDEVLKQELLWSLTDRDVLNESKDNNSSYSENKASLLRSKSISKEMKEMIIKYFGAGSTYHEGGRVHGLIKPKGFTEKTPKSRGVSLGADKDGFYCYTHRAASKRYETPEKISIKDIEFIESTG